VPKFGVRSEKSAIAGRRLIVERLRAVFPHARVIAMSGLAHVSDEAHMAGADAFLCKHDVHAYLIDVIHAVVADRSHLLEPVEASPAGGTVQDP
jgi:hypothetical protein